MDEVSQLGWMDPPEAILSQMDECGVDRAVIMTYTDLPGLNPGAMEYIEGVLQRFPDRFYGYIRLHPWFAESADLLRQAHARGFKGVKFHPVSTLAHPGDPATIKLMRMAGELGMPVLFHCGDEPMTTPWEIAAGIRECPDTAVILGHMGGYFHVDDAIDVAEKYPNVYLDTSAMPYPPKIAEAVERLGPRRILYASDGPGCVVKLELFKVEQAVTQPDARADILGGNILRLLGEVDQ